MKNLLLSIIAINLTFISINLTLRSVEPVQAEVDYYDVKDAVKSALVECETHSMTGGMSFIMGYEKIKCK